MQVMDQIIRWLDGAAQTRQDAELAEAQQARLELEGLLEHPGWKRLADHLTEAIDVLQNKFAEGEDLTPDERAFLKLARRLQKGPVFLLEDARAVIAHAAFTQQSR